MIVIHNTKYLNNAYDIVEFLKLGFKFDITFTWNLKTKLLILGAGGHGHVVAESVTAAKPSIEIVFLDDRKNGKAR